MRGRAAVAVAVLTAVLAVAGGSRADPADGAGEGSHATAAAKVKAGWRPGVEAARRYARRRAGDVRFAIQDDGGRTYKHHAGRAAPARSVFKVMLLAAYLRKKSVRSRPLQRSERKLLGPMIKSSDNAAATTINARLSSRKLEQLARRARMQRFRYEPVIWGNSRTTAGDQVRFMRRFNRLLPRRHRAYARGLMQRIVPSQRWGIAKERPRGWKLLFKSGWGSGTGEADHQVAILERRFCRIVVAIFTVHNPSHDYATTTQRGIAKRLLRGLGRSTC